MKKIALITGASSDLGAAIAKKLSLHYDLILHYNQNKAAVLQLQKELDCKSMIVQADISKQEEVKNMFAIIKAKYPKLNCVINNAAYTKDNPYDEKSADEFQRVIEVNLLGTFLVIKYASFMMNSGNIVNISSTNGIDTESVLSMDYDASKAGIISLTKNFAKALSPNIRVNCIAPGWIDTGIVKKMNPNDQLLEKKKIAIKRFAKPEEIANVVSFVIDEQNSYMIGSIIRVDGGKNVGY